MDKEQKHSGSWFYIMIIVVLLLAWMSVDQWIIPTREGAIEDFSETEIINDQEIIGSYKYMAREIKISGIQPVTLFFTSDNLVDIYIVEANELDKFTSNQNFVYVEEYLNVNKISDFILILPQGDYLIIIESKGLPVQYNLRVVSN